MPAVPVTNVHSAPRGLSGGRPAAATGFVHGICLPGGKAEAGHFPSREKDNNTRKRRALWECSQWESQLSPEHKQRRTGLEVARQSAEAESLGASLLTPRRPRFEVTSLPCPGGNHRRQRHISYSGVCHRKRSLGVSDTHAHSLIGLGVSRLRDSRVTHTRIT